jgi:hypothetical protein
VIGLKPGNSHIATVHQEKVLLKYCYQQQLSKQKEKISTGRVPEYQ